LQYQAGPEACSCAKKPSHVAPFTHVHTKTGNLDFSGNFIASQEKTCYPLSQHSTSMRQGWQFKPMEEG
jgi:hypothetical protein